jgi:DNA-directed RNA polymerase specialized sigma24 family protein
MTAKRDATSPPEIAAPDGTGGPTVTAERSAQVSAAAHVLHALEDLDRVERAALELIYWRGMTQSQVARELDLPQATIRHCIARGMHHMAEHLMVGARS